MIKRLFIGGAICWLLTTVVGFFTFGLMGARIIVFGPPPTFLWYGLMISSALLAAAGVALLVRLWVRA